MRVVLHLSWMDAISWVAGVALDLTLLALLLFRKPARQVTAFSAYFVFFIARELWWYWTVRHVPDISTTNHYLYYISYWASEFVLCVLRLAVAVQVWHLSVRKYPAIWKITWRVVWLVAIGLSAWSALSAYSYRDWIVEFFYVGVQRFEFMQAFVMVVILAFAVQFRIEFSPGYRLLLYGLCFYSVTQCIMATLSFRNPVLTFAWFNAAREVAYALVQVSWIYALYHMVPAVEFKPAPDSAELYDRMAPELNLRMQQLNNRMTEMWNL